MVVQNDGFSGDELSELIQYIANNIDQLIELARRMPALDLDDETADGDCAYILE